MAVEIGTATDHVDLYNKLYTFLTANPDLVAANQQWTLAWSHPDASYPFTPGQTGSDIVLKGPGNAGLDEVYVGMRLNADTPADIFGIWFSGSQGVVSANPTFSDHVNSAPAMHMPVADYAMDYWFVADGRRFIVVVKVSTTFVAAYEGLFLPYATPQEYPYPMISSGCSLHAKRWSDENPAHTHFCMPNLSRFDYQQGNEPYEGYGSYPQNDGLLRVLSPSGEWVMFNNQYNDYRVFPWSSPRGNVSYVSTQTSLIGGGQMITPATLVGEGSRLNGAIGVLDGVFHVTGFGNAAENLVSVAGTDYLVVQNMFRTNFTDYWALRLT